MPKKTYIVLYMPVLHRGYMQFFDAHKDVQDIRILDDVLLSRIDYIRKDLRALTPEQQVETLRGLGRFNSVALLTQDSLTALDKPGVELIFPNEDISHEIAGDLTHAKTAFYPVFLRWDRRATNASDPVNPDRVISTKQFDKEIMKLAMAESLKSSNIWRRVGAVIVRDGKVYAASSNHHLPSDFSLWIDGDPRGTLHKGADIEITTDMHAEAKLIANAAREGVSLKGSSMYVSTFPCPPCSKLIAEAGFKTCYYSSGYAVLDGEELLKAYGVELVHVDEPEADGHPAEWAPYKK